MDMATHGHAGQRAGYLFVLVFILLAAGIVTAGYLYYRDFENRYRTEVEHKLGAVAELKVGDLTQWRKERLGDGHVLFKNAVFAEMARRLMESPENTELREQILAWLTRIQEHMSYHRVILLDAQGALRMSVPETPEPVGSFLSQRASDVLRSGQLTFVDFYRSEYDQRIYLTVMVPIFDEPGGGRPLGTLALCIDPEDYLYPLITRWPTPSRTAESQLVRRDGDDVLFLNELRFQKRAALNLRVPLKGERDRISVKTVLGQEGIAEGYDYRGMPVVAALRRIPDSPWFLVARMDASEVHSSVRERLWATVAFVIVLLAGSGASVGFVWRREALSTYKARLAAAETLRESEARFRSYFDLPLIGVCITSPAKGWLEVNDRVCTLLGYDRAELAGMTWAKLTHPADLAADAAQFNRVLQGEIDRYQIEKRFIRKNGEVVMVDLAVGCVRKPDRTVDYFVALLQDITQRKQQELLLREKNDELTRFTYTVSHDLRSPLVTINTFLGFMENDVRGQDATRIEKDMGYIRTAADKMSRLLDELLELSRVGRKMNPFTEVPLQVIVKEALDLVAGRIVGRGVQVHVTEEPVLLYGDQPRLAEVFQNLVDNAVKFMGDQPAPRVEIGLERTGAEAVLFVRDNGIGIDPRHQGKLFGLFEKLDPAAEGTGIGLAVVRRIVEVHGGRIWVESAGPGKGATFRFTLAARGGHQQKEDMS